MRAVRTSCSSSSSSSCRLFSSSAPRRHSRAAAKRLGRSHRLPVVATSEFWWEDEQEFDALTEVLLPKQVVCCTPTACTQQLQRLQPIPFVAAFCSPAVEQEAEQLWQQLGRAGPPLFLKMRPRDTLEALAQDGTTTSSSSSSSSEAAEQFWQELTGQSWRMDLDYGLNKDATLQSMAEQLLVLVSSSTDLQQLLYAAVGEPNSSSSSSGAGGGTEGLRVVEFSGWNQGERQQQLQSWQQLQPRLAQLPADAAVQA